MVDDLEARIVRLESLMHELHISLAVYAKDHFYRGEERLRAREGKPRKGIAMPMVSKVRDGK